jgi:hypothetical protein
MRVSPADLTEMQQLIAAMESEFTDWESHFQDLAKFILPRRYTWLHRNGTAKGETAKRRNEFILDPTATTALRVLASGMLNGITSPSRPWLRLRFTNFNDETLSSEASLWLEECVRRMLIVMAESNFYSAMAMLYTDLPCFGTAGMIIYEDFHDIIRCYNLACGEYRIGQDDRKIVDRVCRVYEQTVAQLVGRFGIDQVCEQTSYKFRAGGPRLLETVPVCHLIEPNDDRGRKLGGQFTHREYYWEQTRTTGDMLEISGYRDTPGIFPRWELTGNDTYGTSPCMDALPDIMQLQQETKNKGMGLDYMNKPPIVADIAFQTKPNSLLPRGITFVPSHSQIGAKPIYTVNPPINDMRMDIRDIQLRIKEILHNDLFSMISQLETVRTATEIDARREEKLIRLGAVLQRFENEALDPAVKRVFNIMKRRELLPPPPPGFEDQPIEVQYVSVLQDAQRAVGTASTERFLQVIGSLAAAAPEVLQIPDFPELLRDYAERLNVPAVGVKSRERVAEEQAAQADQLAAQQSALVGGELASAAKNLSAADVGGGQNALQALMGT